MEVMYTPRTLIRDALADPEVDQRIKDLISSNEVETVRQGLSFLQTLYPDKYELDLSVTDPERARMAAKARNNLENSPGGIATHDTNQQFDWRQNKYSYLTSRGPTIPNEKHLGAEPIDDPTYQAYFQQVNAEGLRAQVEAEYRNYSEQQEELRGTAPPYFTVAHDMKRRSPNYGKVRVVAIYEDDARNGPAISDFHKLLKKKGYSVGTVERYSTRFDRHGYEFEVLSF